MLGQWVLVSPEWLDSNFWSLDLGNPVGSQTLALEHRRLLSHVSRKREIRNDIRQIWL